MDYAAEMINIAKIKEGLFIGDQNASQNLNILVQFKITHIINAAGHSIPNLFENYGIKYLTLNWADTSNQALFDPQDQIANKIVSYIDNASVNGEGLLVHSVRGQNRVCIVILIYLMRKYNWSLVKSIEFLNSKKADIDIPKYFISQLSNFEKRLSGCGIQKSVTWNSAIARDLDEQVMTNTYLNGLPMAKPKKIEKKHDRKRPKVGWVDRQPGKRASLFIVNLQKDLFFQKDVKLVTSHIRYRPSKSCIKNRNNVDFKLDIGKEAKFMELQEPENIPNNKNNFTSNDNNNMNKVGYNIVNNNKTVKTNPPSNNTSNILNIRNIFNNEPNKNNNNTSNNSNYNISPIKLNNLNNLNSGNSPIKPNMLNYNSNNNNNDNFFPYNPVLNGEQNMNNMKLNNNNMNNIQNNKIIIKANKDQQNYRVNAFLKEQAKKPNKRPSSYNKNRSNGLNIGKENPNLKMMNKDDNCINHYPNINIYSNNPINISNDKIMNNRYNYGNNNNLLSKSNNEQIHEINPNKSSNLRLAGPLSKSTNVNQIVPQKNDCRPVNIFDRKLEGKKFKVIDHDGKNKAGMFLTKSHNKPNNYNNHGNMPLNNFNPNLVKRTDDLNTFNKKYGYNRGENNRMKNELGPKKPSTPDPIKMIYFNNLENNRYADNSVNMPKLNQNYNSQNYVKNMGKNRGPQTLKRPSTAPEKEKNYKTNYLNKTYKHNGVSTSQALKRVPSPMLGNNHNGLRRPLSNSQKIDKKMLRVASPMTKTNFNYEYFNRGDF